MARKNKWMSFLDAFFGLLKLCLFIIIGCLVSATAQAGEIDVLVDILVKKKVLTESEARQVLKETREIITQNQKKKLEKATKAVEQESPNTMRDSLPNWIRNTGIAGDLKLRYAFTDIHEQLDRHRMRVRCRLGFVTYFSDRLHIGFGLASGGSNPRSAHMTMSDSFDTKDIRIDYAFAAYTPFPWLSVLAGKFNNPLWETADLLFDSEIRPEGITAKLKFTPGSRLDLFCTSGFWILDERRADENDPVMLAIQQGYRFKINNSCYIKQAFTMYAFSNVKDNMLDYSSQTNTLTDKGALRYDYDAFAVSSELGFRTSCSPAPFLGIISDYIRNTRTHDNHSGYLVGIVTGHEKIQRRHQWRCKVLYRRLEKDGWLDIFPDGGTWETDIKGITILLRYGFSSKVVFGINFHHMSQIKRNRREIRILEFDIDYLF